ncbi:DUF3817 domain-containing protein [Priestia megaterium]|nr:DUF3817 domain-containing protein [Priestia megaterium]
MILSSSIGRLRIVGVLEGISYLLLLFIAMPLKYLAGIPEVVSVVGAAHGALFVLYILAVVQVKFVHKKSVAWGLYAFILSVIPFGTFVLDRQLKNEQ